VVLPPDRVHPDSLTGDELAEVLELFEGVYWDDPGAVRARVDDLRALSSVPDPAP
jgi:hypothetical protein